MATKWQRDIQRQVNSLKSEIRKLEKEKQKMFSTLGKEAYLFYINNNLAEPPLQSTCENIKQMDDAIVRSEEQIEELRRFRTEEDWLQAQVNGQVLDAHCVSCGSPIPSSAQFCRECGAQQTAPEQQYPDVEQQPGAQPAQQTPPTPASPGLTGTQPPAPPGYQPPS